MGWFCRPLRACAVASPVAFLIFVAAVAHAAFSQTTANSGAVMAVANSFGLTQDLAGTAGCISDTGTGGVCATDSRAATMPWGMASTSDGADVYVAIGKDGNTSGGVFGYDRSSGTGALTQMAGAAYCVTQDGDAGGCVNGEGLRGAPSVAISPDDAHVYVAGFNSWGVATLTRNTTTGALTQPAHATNDCVSELGTDRDSGGSCLNGHGLYNPQGLVVSGDGKNVYVASRGIDGGSGTIAILDRNTSTGVLTQDATTAGCISDTGTTGCLDGRGLGQPSGVTISPDDTTVYLSTSSATADGVVVFSRNTTTGDLTQLAGTAGCVTLTGADGCASGVALDSANNVKVSPDGRNVYVTTGVSDSVAVFDRNTTTGALTQKAGTAGCISETGTTGSCVDGQLLDGPQNLVVSPDGQNVYVISYTSAAVNTFVRDTTTGTLTQVSTTAKCLTDTGNAGVCYNGKLLGGPIGLLASPDGADIYATGYTGNGISFLKRDR